MPFSPLEAPFVAQLALGPPGAVAALELAVSGPNPRNPRHLDSLKAGEIVWGRQN